MVGVGLTGLFIAQASALLEPMRIVSWNVNGIRACVRKGFVPWLKASKAQIVGLQEVRAKPEQVPDELAGLPRWHQSYHSAERAGYSGVGMISRRRPDEIVTDLGVERFDREARLQVARFGRLFVVNGYFPKGSGTERDNSRVPYKLDFYRAVFDLLEPLRRDKARILVMGDLNTAHREIDLARPKQNVHNSGFLAEEREELQRWVDAGWTDTFRAFHAGGGHYSWWSQRIGARERNVGWRIDYVLASPSAMPLVRRAFILPDVRGSDHCPVGVDVDSGIVGAR